MTDDLVKRLRAGPSMFAQEEAADRIEQLAERLAERDAYKHDIETEIMPQVAHLEALLAKAEAALAALMHLNDNGGPFGGEIYQDRVDRAWDRARATLAAIREGTDK